MSSECSTIDFSTGTFLDTPGTAATAITATSASYPSTSGFPYPGPDYHFTAEGTWGGTTVTLQEKTGGHSNWVTIGTFTADTSTFTRCNVGSSYRATLAGGSGISLLITFNKYEGRVQ